jgi:hypothetical protein
MLAPIKEKLLRYIKKLSPDPKESESEFTKRVRNRHKTFWKTPNAEIVRNTIMNATDPIEKWRDVENWQRKLSNKYNSREFAKMHSCRLPDLYWKGRNPETFDFDSLPENFVVRPTIGHSSGLVFLMKGSLNLMDSKTWSKEDIKQALSRALDQNYILEFLIEEFLRTENGEYKIPDDYKLYMFNGEVATIQVINRLGPSKGFTNCYDEHWNPMENVNIYYATGTYQPPPKCLAEMVEKAKELSKSYEIFVRIDFYATDKGATFGEFTPTPFMGYSFTEFGNQLFINYWDRFCKGKI